MPTKNPYADRAASSTVLQESSRSSLQQAWSTQSGTAKKLVNKAKQ